MIQITQAALHQAVKDAPQLLGEGHTTLARGALHSIVTLLDPEQHKLTSLILLKSDAPKARAIGAPHPAPNRKAEDPPSTLPAGPEAEAESTEDPPLPAEEGAQPAAPAAAPPQGTDAPPGDDSTPFGRKADKWTDARKALLCEELWYALPKLTDAQMLQRLNALPARFPIAPGQIQGYALTRLNVLKRSSPEWLAEAQRRQAAAAAQGSAQPSSAALSDDTPAPPQSAQPPGATSDPEGRGAAEVGRGHVATPAGERPAPREPSPQRHGHHLPSQHKDETEAKEMLRNGFTVRQVAEEFGLTMGTVSMWQLQVRKESETTA